MKRRKIMMFGATAATTLLLQRKGFSMEMAQDQTSHSVVRAVPTEPATAMLFPGFKRYVVTTTGTTINTIAGGQGPALLLLHGHPQTMACWHKVASALAAHFTVVLADLRGYGD